MLNSCILEAQNTFFPSKSVEKHGYSAHLKMPEFSRFPPPLLLVEIQFFGHIQKVHVTERRMTFFLRQNPPSSSRNLWREGAESAPVS